jgi:tRNA A37 threonylcarbamoyladenosine dehydratase
MKCEFYAGCDQEGTETIPLLVIDAPDALPLIPAKTHLAKMCSTHKKIFIPVQG